MTKRTQLFLAALVLVAILAHGYVYWWAHTEDHGVFDTVALVKNTSDSLAKSYPLAKQQPGIKPAAQVPGGSEAVEMREYTDTELKFSLKYPAEWQVSRSEVGGTTTYCIKLAESTGACPLTLIVTNVAVGVNMSAVSDQYEADLRNASVQRTEMKVAGEEAVVLTASGGQKVAVFEHDKMVYSIIGIQNTNAIFDSITGSLSFY